MSMLTLNFGSILWRCLSQNKGWRIHPAIAKNITIYAEAQLPSEGISKMLERHCAMTNKNTAVTDKIPPPCCPP